MFLSSICFVERAYKHTHTDAIKIAHKCDCTDDFILCIQEDFFNKYLLLAFTLVGISIF